MPFPCDRLLSTYDSAYFRGVTVRARPETVFRWLCQLRVAPYAYDWADNWGRRSPRRLIPGLDQLELGQKLLIGFRLVDFERGRHLTIEGDARHVLVFGNMVATYLAAPAAEGCRLLVKVLARYPRGPHGWMWRRVLPWGDLWMMRKQLLTFKELAEATEQERPPALPAPQ